jgi:hypothetical protein
MSFSYRQRHPTVDLALRLDGQIVYLAMTGIFFCAVKEY